MIVENFFRHWFRLHRNIFLWFVTGILDKFVYRFLWNLSMKIELKKGILLDFWKIIREIYIFDNEWWSIVLKCSYFSRENFRKTFGRIFDELPSWQWLRFKKTINHLSLVSLRSSFIACLLIELYRSMDTRFAWISARLEIFLLTFHGILEWFITNIPALHRKWQIFTTRQPEIQGIVWLESIFLTYRIIWRKRENVFNLYFYNQQF